MALTATIAAAVAGRTVRASLMEKFEFTSSTEYLWGGDYELTTAGQTWKPGGRLISVDGLQTRVDLAAKQLTFKLSGVDANLVAIAKDSADEAKGNPCYVYLQFFDEDWSPLDSPVLISAATMDQLSYKTTGPTMREITLTAEGIFIARNYAPYAYYSDRDQNGRFSGDRGLELMGSLVYKAVTWPDY